MKLWKSPTNYESPMKTRGPNGNMEVSNENMGFQMKIWSIQ